jgi:hypothetical protein
MSLSFGILLVINLHVLGFMRNVPFEAVHRLLPWGMAGLILNVASGMMFFTAVPQQYLENPTFQWKVFLLVLAGLNYLYLTVFDRPWDMPRKGVLLIDRQDHRRELPVPVGRHPVPGAHVAVSP